MNYIKDLEDWIIKLKKSKKLILVEGKKDRKSLKLFGIDKIMTINKPLFEIVEIISSKFKECIILTDLDPEGRKIYSYIRRNLERNGVKVDNKYREFLFKNTKIRNIEGLRNYLK